MQTSTLIKTLKEIAVIKYGAFTLKSGTTSPIYIDLRLIVSYPSVLQQVADLIWDKIAHLHFDLICGVPYTALPIATCIAVKHQIPMVLRRKEAKTYGTKKMIEGVFKSGQSCLVVEDVITTAGSVVETIEDLQQAGLRVPYVVSFVDREQGGEKTLLAQGCEFFRVFSLTDLLSNE